MAALILAFALPYSATASTTLIPTGSVWRYTDNNSNLGASWSTSTFDDSGWSTGVAELGFGDGDEATVINGGPSGNRYVTAYFRKTFTVNNATGILSAQARILRDDGAVVYVNGTEAFRTNMPTGTITSATLASTAINVPEEASYYTYSVSPSLLLEGTNIIAVELHQGSLTSSDSSFNLELTTTGHVTRGPYLQNGTSGSVVLRWRTDVSTDTRVKVGTVQGLLNLITEDISNTFDHEIKVTGLLPDTKYYYSVGSRSVDLEGNDSEHYFVTSPAPGADKAFRMWVLGDSGTATAAARNVRDAYYGYAGNRHTDLWLMLGDNAYNSGLDSEYQAAVFDMYPSLLQRSTLWPTLGNHDDMNPTVYFNIFTLPQSGEAGGLASGTESYYSFDFGRVHFICLDSEGTADRTTTGPMLTWLQNDLNSTMQDWIICFFHHPPYTKGSHNSDSVSDSGGRMVDMRQYALPILEAGGVDLVLTGHSHSYERSYFLDGHYGFSASYSTATMVINGGNGRIGGNGAYSKASYSATNAGAVYAVAGSSGQISGGSLNHPAMCVSLNTLGSMVIDIDGNQLDARFLSSTGTTPDYFTIVKDSATTPTVVNSVRSDNSPTSSSMVVGFDVTFNHQVTAVDISDFVLATSGGISGASITGINGSGRSYHITVNTGTGDGTIRLDVVDDDSIQDAVGSYLGGPGTGNGSFTSGQTYTISNPTPVNLSHLAID
ncbi:MAG: metallophosphoesterase family protein [Candidatus Sumerlaeaceae bacterium]|nr:metallophosphoesterase family protein [Candidatus Sumerlaeaceae bacterium]